MDRRPRRYLDIHLPTEFVLEARARDGSWLDQGLYRASDFARLDDGSYVCAGEAGSPLFLRCVDIHADVIEVVDGNGRQFTYRLVPFPGKRYQPRP